MAVATFPYMSYLGYNEEVEVMEIVEVYGDLTFDVYRDSDDFHVITNMVFKEIDKVQKDDIKAFWKARKMADTPGDYEFYYYDPEETNVASGSAGKCVGIFLEPTINFERSGKCTWNIQFPVLKLRAA